MNTVSKCLVFQSPHLELPDDQAWSCRDHFVDGPQWLELESSQCQKLKFWEGKGRPKHSMSHLFDICQLKMPQKGILEPAISKMICQWDTPRWKMCLSEIGAGTEWLAYLCSRHVSDWRIKEWWLKRTFACLVCPPFCFKGLGLVFQSGILL